MALKAVHDTLDEIPEPFRELYTEKGDKWELTAIQGVKTGADVERVQTSLHKAQGDNKDLKAKLAVWGELEHDEVVARLDRIPELEAAAKGRLDEAQVEEIVARRVEGTIRSKLAGPERRVKELEKACAELTEENGKFRSADRTRKVHDFVRRALVDSKVLPDAHEDALLLADRVFEIREDDSAIVTRDNVGVPPGLDAAGWLTEIQDRRRHWWPESVGGGSRGSGAGVGGPSGKNPWSHEHWSMTEQGRVFKEHGRDRCDQLARAAGTKFGGGRPQPKKAATA